MAILTKTVISSAPPVAGTVWKGDKKPSNGAGKTLKERLRFTGKSENITNIIHKSYNGDRQGYDVLVDQLTIIAYARTIEETFDVNMKTWGKLGPSRECDRHTIKAEAVEKKNMHGEPYTILQKCNKPCPLRDEESLGTLCPNGCKQEGVFYFQIPELKAKGINMPCSLTTHSWLDVTEDGLLGQLRAIEDEFGSIRFAPDGFELEEFGRYIPLVLSRYKRNTKRPITGSEKHMIAGQSVAKRTGGKADMEVFPLSVSVHPGWLRLFRNRKQVKNIQALGYQPSPQLLKDAGFDVVDAEIVSETHALPSAEDWQAKAFDWAIDQGLPQDQARTIVNQSTEKKACFVALRTAIADQPQPEVIQGEFDELEF